jgi:membrane protein DedA with SNARE-associated domain
MLGTLIETHGYWVLVLGCLLEGETVLVLAGFAAHRGYLDPWAVWGLASLAGFAGDECYFWLGRRHGGWMLARWPSVAKQAHRVRGALERYPATLILGVRFAYGLRVAGPVLIGTTALPAWRFALLNAIGAMLWAGLLAGLGWVFGSAAEVALGHIRHIEGWLLLGLLAAGLLLWVVRRQRTRQI